MLLTKLHIPSTGENLVPRPSLFDKLDKGYSRKLILISAPAGFGKTVLLSEWIKKNNISFVWFSIDSNDNDIAGFFNYIISGLQKYNENFGQAALSLIKSPKMPDPKSIVHLLINDFITIDHDILLVLDDFHFIQNEEIRESIAYLLDYLPKKMHLVLLSREDPDLPIAKLRSQQLMIELRSQDLKFSVNEIAALFSKKFKIKLSVEDLKALEKKTEGWIAGLQLAALSMQNHSDKSAFISAFAGNNRYIMDYLIGEVLKVQSSEIKDFLLETSILGQFCAPLCNFILNRNDSQDILEKLENENMFIFPLDNHRKWYRYHHLFADLLQQRLQARSNADVVDLHSNASKWFEKNNMYILAIEHLIQIEDHQKSLKILSQLVEEMWENGQHAAILRYGNTFPVEMIKTNPEFCLYYSWILTTTGNALKALPLLKSAEKLVRKEIRKTELRGESPWYYKELLGKIALAFAYLFSHQESNDKSFDYCKLAMNNLSEDNPFWRAWSWFSYGISFYSRGKLQKSSEAFNKAFEYAQKSGNIYLISTVVIRMAESEQQMGRYKSAYKKCSDLLSYLNKQGYGDITKTEWTYAALYHILGITEFMQMEFEKARKNIEIAYQLAIKGNDVFQKVFTMMVYSVLLFEYRDPNAEKIRNELEDLLKRIEIPHFLNSYYVGWKIHFYIENNQLDHARKLVIENKLSINGNITFANEMAYASFARLLLHTNKLDAAEELLNKLYKLVFERQEVERLIDIKTSFSILYNKKNDLARATEYLNEAMLLASKENLLSYFTYDNENINEVLEEIFNNHAKSKTNIPNTFIKNLKAALEKKKKIRKNNNLFDLSPREIDTLKLCATDLTNQEIANRLFISLNTVKTHLKNINIKLDVNSRMNAVSKAQELGIISKD